MSSRGRERSRTFARRLRKRQTNAEKVLWNALRNRKLLGMKFLRQHPVHTDSSNSDVFYIADFYCHDARLVIEIDGPIHELRKEYDKRRSEVFAAKRLRVIRFKNEEVEQDLLVVLEKISQALLIPPIPLLFSKEKGRLSGG